MAASVTAALLVIGDEILSGRTKDKNIGYIAEYLTEIGIDLREVRVVPDVEDEIVAAVNALRGRYTYLFTTGGIGPTHDDITADCVAKAFGVAIDVDPRAVAMMRERYKPEDLNEARLRMARIPEGADLIDNPISQGARLPHRQCHRHGRRALDHAGHARQRGADARDRRPHDHRDDRGGRRCRRAFMRRGSARSPRRIRTSRSAPIRPSRRAAFATRSSCAARTAGGRRRSRRTPCAISSAGSSRRPSAA